MPFTDPPTADGRRTVRKSSLKLDKSGPGVSRSEVTVKRERFRCRPTFDLGAVMFSSGCAVVPSTLEVADSCGRPSSLLDGSSHKPVWGTFQVLGPKIVYCLFICFLVTFQEFKRQFEAVQVLFDFSGSGSAFFALRSLFKRCR